MKKGLIALMAVFAVSFAYAAPAEESSGEKSEVVKECTTCKERGKQQAAHPRGCPCCDKGKK